MAGSLLYQMFKPNENEAEYWSRISRVFASEVLILSEIILKDHKQNLRDSLRFKTRQVLLKHMIYIYWHFNIR